MDFSGVIWYTIQYVYATMEPEGDCAFPAKEDEAFMKREMPELRSFMPKLFEKREEGIAEADSPKIRLGTGRKTGEPIDWMPWEGEQMHACILGAPGTGKTQMIKSVIVQLLRQRRDMGILVLDFKGDYNESKPEFVEVTQARVLKIHHLSLSPFDLRGMEPVPQLHVHTAMDFADAMAASYNLDPIQKSTLVQSVMAAYTACGITEDPKTWTRSAPTFAQVYREYQERPSSQHNDSLEHILENLAAMDLFAEEPDEKDRYSSFRGVVVLDLSGYSEQVKNLAAMVILNKFCDRMAGSVPKAELGKLVLVDETDDILSRGCPVLKRILQEGKERGVGVILSARYPDFLQTMGFDCREYISLWLVHRVEELRRSELEYILRRDFPESMVEQLYYSLRQLEHNESLVIREEEPVFMENLPFRDISTDTAQTYLRQTVQEPEEDVFAGMQELDVTHLEVFALEEELPLETLDIFEEMV